MLVKKTAVIIVLFSLSAFLFWYAYRISFSDVQGKGDDSILALITSVAGAITTLSVAVFGAAAKWIEIRKASLDLEKQKLEVEKKRRELS
jgi:hypothetical protein